MKTLIFIFLASTSFAALPPLAQSVREYKALLADPQFYASFKSADQVKEILRTERGFLVLTQNSAMHVDIHYKEAMTPGFMGPAQFELEFSPPVSLN
ncbi:MAG: hypothetical protein COT85_00130 [Chlamydiae bacterium CG10_big_fil_rev_8_21_14_0_10_42_34]|nr:MAG: hypothetical protein COT85_00130 [Chlamydiae bacterium CG10_big_fil_rev_8_21_14_0_10_42_34]